jgi:glutamate transport system substrate-binding protein
VTDRAAPGSPVPAADPARRSPAPRLPEPPVAVPDAAARPTAAPPARTAPPAPTGVRDRRAADAEPAGAVGWIRLAAVATVLLLAVAAAVAIVVDAGPPSEQQLIEKAGLVGKRELLVGVKDDQPGLALRDPVTGHYSGFDIDIAYLVAADLGFRPDEVRFLSIESEDRAKMQASTGTGFATVDLVVASYSITPAREALPQVSFSAPYLYTEQSVITLTGHRPVRSLADLRGERVCTIATSTSQSPAVLAGDVVDSRNRISDCVAGLRRGEFAAVTTDAAILAGYVAKDRAHLRHYDIGLDGQEAYGINTGGNEALRTLVNLALYRSLHDPRDRRWEDAFNRWLLPEQAANLPQQVAIDRQPDVPPVPVRQWPWQSALGRPPGRWEP